MITRALALALIVSLLPIASFAAQPPKAHITCDVSADKTVVKPGEKVIISWISSKSIITYGPDNTTTTPFGSMEVTPIKKTIYKFKFVGLGGNKKCGVRIRMAGQTIPQ